MNINQPGLGKLIYNIGHIASMVNRETVAPLHVSIWPTARCQFDCEYCMGKDMRSNRELTIEEFRSAIDVLVFYGTRAIEFSGMAGEPLLWRHFEEAVEICKDNDLRVSLITNGLLLHALSAETLDRLSWVRISIQNIDHLHYLSESIKRACGHTKVTASIMVSETDDLADIGDMVVDCMKNNLTCRIACVQPCSDNLTRTVKGYIQSIKSDSVFYAEKEKGSPLGCYSAWIRAAINNDGAFLPCPSIPLSNENKGTVPEKFHLCHVSDLAKWLLANRVHDLGYKCSFCNCTKENNDYIHKLLTGVSDEYLFV